MRKKYVWAVTVIAIFLVGIYLLALKNHNSKTPIPASKTKEIIYGVNGYIPKEAFIKSGDTITFKNLGKSNMRPASDPHPSRDTYPNFDPKKEFQTGESWNFTFTEPGVWQYHDELNPSHQATITVR